MMKTLISTLILFAYFTSSFAQVTMDPESELKNHQKDTSKAFHFPDSLKIHKVYFSIGFGYPWMLGGDITYLSKKNLGFSVNVSTYSLKATNLPGDYTSSLWGMGGNPRDTYLAASILFVADFRVSNQKLRPGIEAGISYANYQEVQFDRTEVGWGALFGDTQNYKTSETSESFAAFQGRLKLEVLPTKNIGIEFALFANISGSRPFIGLEAIFMLGKTREQIWIK